jgi:hypothetical protein
MNLIGIGWNVVTEMKKVCVFPVISDSVGGQLFLPQPPCLDRKTQMFCREPGKARFVDPGTIALPARCSISPGACTKRLSQLSSTLERP